MTNFERAVLQVLTQSNEALGWYQIERRLSNIALDERPPLPPVLDDLVARGWLRESASDAEPKKKYAVTQAGRGELGE